MVENHNEIFNPVYLVENIIIYWLLLINDVVKKNICVDLLTKHVRENNIWVNKIFFLLSREKYILIFVVDRKNIILLFVMTLALTNLQLRWIYWWLLLKIMCFYKELDLCLRIERWTDKLYSNQIIMLRSPIGWHDVYNELVVVAFPNCFKLFINLVWQNWIHM